MCLLTLLRIQYSYWEIFKFHCFRGLENNYFTQNFCRPQVPYKMAMHAFIFSTELISAQMNCTRYVISWS